MRQTAAIFTERHPDFIEDNASHFQGCREGMQAFVAQVICPTVDSGAMWD
ncbi:hypothetical protein T636_A1245 [Enterobacter hormaechei subsp. xiangfangensis]|nr:hypothetical protein T636_A1245 [Enterobacter hormaechei subsp. xiangfangensis]